MSALPKEDAARLRLKFQNILERAIEAMRIAPGRSIHDARLLLIVDTCEAELEDLEDAAE